MEINFVTSSQNKIQELSEVLGEQFTVNQLQAELPEHQSMDLHEIIQAKLKSAQEIHPDKIIIVEDTAFEIDALNGLPGPFIKFFELAVGDQGVYEMARGVQNDGALSARAKVAIGLFHNNEIKFFDGTLEGEVVEETGEGWGFDKIFIPEGYETRLGSLGMQVKSKISHRAIATKALKSYLDQNYI